MNRRFAMTRSMRLGTAILKCLLHLGVPMGSLRLLTHQGRNSGKLYQTPVALVEQDGSRWLVAAFGEVNWVRNIRAAGEATLSSGWRSETVQLVDLDASTAAPILRLFLRRFGIVPFIPPYFEATTDSDLADFEHEVTHHPVFRVVSRG